MLVLSQYVEEAYALELLSQSTERTGYLLKDRVADIETFTDAVRRVAKGGSALDPEVVALMLGRRRREDPLASLTPREREVLGLMAEGRSNSAMAEALVVSERAVEKHVTSILSKLDLPPAAEDHRRVLAVLTFLRCRLAENWLTVDLVAVSATPRRVCSLVGVLRASAGIVGRGASLLCTLLLSRRVYEADLASAFWSNRPRAFTEDARTDPRSRAYRALE